MAKNLKLNIKNAQLAQALKLNQPKKPSTKKEKPIDEEAASQEQLPPPAIQEPVSQETIATAPVQEEAPQVPVTAKEPEKQPSSPVTPVSESKPQPPPKKFLPGFEKRFDSPGAPRREQGFHRREDSHPQARSYSPQGPRPPYPQSRPPYQARPGAPQKPGYPNSRPPYPGSRPPFKREGAGETHTHRSIPPIKEPIIKEIPQQHQVHNKKASVSAGEADDSFPKKVAASKDVKAQKKPLSFRAFDSRDRQGLRDNDDEVWRKRKAPKTRLQMQEEVIRPKQLKIRLPITVKDLAAEMKLKASQLIAKLFMQGVIITLNDYLDDETTVQLLGHEFECEITVDTTEEERIRVTGKTIKQEIQESDPASLLLRPPVIMFMGHVDHGKTSLIDTIRKSNIVSTEAGAITQHIGAFKCHTAVGDITILDTPGHEAFSAMRSRGADVTDIAVLVVAGDEGIKAQTIEALQQAQEAHVPIVVAINKCDKPNFNPEQVYRQLADQNLLPETWGGTTITVNCSAVTGQGIKELLEMLALQAEILELKANPSTRARGTVIESEMHKGLGAVTTVLVQNGTLRIGDALVFDQFYARIKTMRDEHERELMLAPPSTPVKITGLSGLPEAGSEFIVVKDEKEAREISEKRNEGQKNTLLQQNKKTPVENILKLKAESNEKKVLNLILKADVQGSLEALKNSLRKLPSQKVELRFISEGVGEISESDIQFAATSKATIIGFHTQIESHAEFLIKQTKVKVSLYDVIYHAVDEVKALMLTLLDKIPQENDVGEAVVKAVFKSSQLGNIAGCQVSTGTIRRNSHARLLRGGEVIWKGPLASLKRVKEDVKEVQKGHECGIVLQGFNAIQEGDVIQAYEITYLQQELT